MSLVYKIKEVTVGKLFLLLLAMPLLELFLLIKVGSIIGPLATIALCVATAALGSLLLRAQGLQTLMRVRQNLDRGELPALEMAEGAALLVAGAMLLTPGLATDVLGFLILVPPLRREVLLRVMRQALQPAGPRTVVGEAHPAKAEPTPRMSVRRIEIVDGQFQDIDDKSEPR